jgi:hypothetical protein
VVLEVQPNTRKINKRLDTSLSELLWVTNTRALKDERRAKGTSGDDDLLASPERPAMVLTRRERLSRHGPDPNCSAAFNDNLVNLCVDG